MRAIMTQMKVVRGVQPGFIVMAIAFLATGCGFQYGNFFSKVPNPALLRFVVAPAPTAQGNAVNPSPSPTVTAQPMVSADLGSTPVLTLATLSVALQNTGDLDATDISFSSDDPLDYGVQGQCTKVSGGGNDLCVIAIAFRPQAVNKLAANVLVHYSDGNGNRATSSLPVTGMSLCAPGISVSGIDILSANAMTSGGTSTVPIAVNLAYNGDLLKNVSTAASATCQLTAGVSLKEFVTSNFLSSVTGVSPNFTTVANGHRVYLPSSYTMCGDINASLNIAKSCTMEVDFSVPSTASNPFATGTFSASLLMSYFNGNNNIYLATTINTSSGNKPDETYTLVQSPSTITSAWNSGNSITGVADGGKVVTLHFGGTGTSNTPATIYALTYPTNDPTFILDQTHTTCTASLSGVDVQPSGCDIVYRFNPLSSVVNAYPASRTFTASSPVTLSYGFRNFGITPANNNVITQTITLTGTANPPANLVVWLRDYGSQYTYQALDLNSILTSPFSYPGITGESGMPAGTMTVDTSGIVTLSASAIPNIIPAPSATFNMPSNAQESASNSTSYRTWYRVHILNVGGTPATGVNFTYYSDAARSVAGMATGFNSYPPNCSTINPGIANRCHSGVSNDDSYLYYGDVTSNQTLTQYAKLTYNNGSYTSNWASNNLPITFTGNFHFWMPDFQLSPSSINFTSNLGSSVVGGQSIRQKVTATVGLNALQIALPTHGNSGNFSFAPDTDSGVSDPASGSGGSSVSCFSNSSPTSTYTFSAQSRCTFYLVFTPNSAGSFSDTFTVNAGSFSKTVNVSGVAENAPSVYLSSSSVQLSPSTVTIGQRSSAQFTLNNSSGHIPVNIGTPTLASGTSSDIQIDTSSCPAQLTGSCPVTIYFTPTSSSSASVSGTMNFTYDTMSTNSSDSQVSIASNAHSGSGTFSGSFNNSMSYTANGTSNASAVTLAFGSTSPGTQKQVTLNLTNIVGFRSTGWLSTTSGVFADEASGSTIQGQNLPSSSNGRVTVDSNTCRSTTAAGKGGTSSGGPGSCSIVFDYNSTAADTLNNSVTLHYYKSGNTSDSTQGTITLNFTGSSSGPQGSLSASPTTLTFGRNLKTASSGPTDQVITFTNNSGASPAGAPVHITSIALSNSGMPGSFSTASSLPAGTSGTMCSVSNTNINQGSSCLIPIHFKAQSVGGLTGTLSVGWSDGTNTGTTTANLAGTGTQMISVAAGGNNTCIINEVGHVQCWGSNSSGQLGIPSFGIGRNSNYTASSSSPVSFSSGFGNPVQVSVGSEYACALSDSGNVSCWGSNSQGQLGYSFGQNSNSPGSFVSLGGSATKIATGFAHACAILSNGSVQCWGDNRGGQLANGNTTATATPQTVALPTHYGPVTSISAGVGHTCVIFATNGVTECWGGDLYGQLGQGFAAQFVNTGTDQLNPIILSSGASASSTTPPAFLSNLGVSQSCTTNSTPGGASYVGTGTGQAFSCVVPTDNTAGVRCFGQTMDAGSSYVGILGFQACRNSVGDPVTVGPCGGTPACPSNPMQQNYNTGAACSFSINCSDVGSGMKTISMPFTSGTSIAQLSLGDAHGCVLAQSGSNSYIGCWGANPLGQLGNGTTTGVGANPGDFGPNFGFAFKPSDIASGVVPIQIATGSNHTCTVLSNNTVKCWGEGGTFHSNGSGADTGSARGASVSPVYLGN